MTPGPEQHAPDDNTPTDDEAPTADDEAPTADGEIAQQLLGFMTNDEWDGLLGHVNSIIREVEHLPDEKTRKRVLSMLQGIDAIHRESLTRLVRLFKEGVLAKVVTDPPIHTLMELYDLLPEEPDEAEAAAPQRPPAQRPFPNIPIKVESGGSSMDAPKTPPKPPPKPLPHWVPVLSALDKLAIGEVRKIPADDREVLLCRVKDQELFALDTHCAQDDQLMADATLNQYSLICPHHPACYYDVRQGTRLAGPGTIECYPVKIEDSQRVMVGIGMDFVPKLPSF